MKQTMIARGLVAAFADAGNTAPDVGALLAELNSSFAAFKDSKEKEIAALQARVEALEYHLLMLMQSLKQPQTQPTGIPMKYPIWNYSLQN